jgi:hypothetical protein
MLARRRRAIGLHAGKPEQLEGCGADAASRTGDECRLAGLCSPNPMDRLIRRHVVQDHGRSVPVRDIVGNGEELRRIPHDHLAEAAVDRERGHALPDTEVLHAGSQGIDDARDLVAGHEGELGAVAVVAGQRHQVRRSDARGPYAHAKLPGARVRSGELHDLERVHRFRTAFAGQHHGSVGLRHGEPLSVSVPWMAESLGDKRSRPPGDVAVSVQP